MLLLPSHAGLMAPCVKLQKRFRLVGMKQMALPAKLAAKAGAAAASKPVVLATAWDLAVSDGISLAEALAALRTTIGMPGAAAPGSLLAELGPGVALGPFTAAAELSLCFSPDELLLERPRPPPGITERERAALAVANAKGSTKPGGAAATAAARPPDLVTLGITRGAGGELVLGISKPARPLQLDIRPPGKDGVWLTIGPAPAALAAPAKAKAPEKGASKEGKSPSKAAKGSGTSGKAATATATAEPAAAPRPDAAPLTARAAVPQAPPKVAPSAYGDFKSTAHVTAMQPLLKQPPGWSAPPGSAQGHGLLHGYLFHDAKAPWRSAAR